MKSERVMCMIDPTKECDCELRDTAQKELQKLADEINVPLETASDVVTKNFQKKSPEEQLIDMEEEKQYYLDHSIQVSACHNLPNETD